MNIIKAFGFFLMLTFAAGEALGQQIPLYSQYYYNPFLYNPARTGEKEDVQLYLMYRKQWADFKGAPETRALSLDGMVKNKIGIGGYVFSDITDIVERLSGHLAYAYYFKFGDHKLSLGISAGVQEVKVDYTKAIVDDLNEPLLGDVQRGLNFDASVGISYWFKGLQVGFSVPQVLGTSIKYDNDAETSYRFARHYLATVGYSIPLADEVFFIEPNAMFRSADKFNTFQVDIGSAFRYRELAWITALYRYDYALSFGGGFRVHERISVGYSYDHVLNPLKDYAGGTHELLLGITFGKKDNKEKGLVETIKNLESRQQQQAAQISEIKEENQSLKEDNRRLEQAMEQREIELEQLKQEINTAVREYQDSLRNNQSERLELQDDYLQGIKRDDIKIQPDVPQNGKTDEPPAENYMIVLGAYGDRANAAKKVTELQQKNTDAGLFYNKNKNLYYIYLKNTGSIRQGLSRLEQLKQTSQFKDAWIYYIED